MADGEVPALHYSVGITITEDMQEAILKVPVGRLVRGRRLRLRLAHQRPWAIEITAAVTRLQAMPSG